MNAPTLCMRLAALLLLSTAACDGPYELSAEQMALGTAGCRSPDHACSDGCRNLNSDIANCGNCGNRCAPGSICALGRCVLDQHQAAAPVATPSMLGPLVTSWSQVSPSLSGRLDGVAVAVAGTPNRLVISSPGGGVFAQSSLGTWSAATGISDYSVYHLENDLFRTGRMYAVSRSDIYASTSNGTSWTNLTGNGGAPAPLWSMNYPPPQFTNNPYPFIQVKISSSASVIVWARACDELYYSVDGSSFTPLSLGFSNPDDNCVTTMTSDSAHYVYLATQGQGPSDLPHVFISSCAWTSTGPCTGMTWNSFTSGFTSAVQGGFVSAMTDAAPTGIFFKNRVFAAVQTGGGTSDIWYSETQGNWTHLGSQPGSPSGPDTRVLNWTGGASKQLLLGAYHPWQTANYYSPSWTDFLATGQHSDLRAFAWSTTSPCVSGGSTGCLWGTTDGNNMTDDADALQEWIWTPGTSLSGSSTSGNVSLSGVTSTFEVLYSTVTTSSSGATRLFTGAIDDGSDCSDNRGGSWNSGQYGPGGGDQFSLVVAPSNGDIAYARFGGSDDQHFLKSTTAGPSSLHCYNLGSWSSVSLTGSLSYIHIPWIHNQQMTAVDPTSSGRVYFATDTAIGTTSDGSGNVSSCGSLPSCSSPHPVNVFVDPSHNVFVGTIGCGVYKSTDNCSTWSQWALYSSPPAAVLHMAYSSSSYGNYYLIGTTNGMTRCDTSSTPSCTDVIAFSPAYPVSTVTVDPSCPQRIYAGYGFVGFYGANRGGIDLSTDGGSTFPTSLTAGYALHETPISDIQVDPVSSEYVFAATYGQGVWRYDRGATSCP